jgi:tRNA1(Val) A37 N6-methylase TrmN6
VDALLLARFASQAPGGWTELVDLGCGCGVVGLAMLLDAVETRFGPGRAVSGGCAGEAASGPSGPPALSVGEASARPSSLPAASCASGRSGSVCRPCDGIVGLGRKDGDGVATGIDIDAWSARADRDGPGVSRNNGLPCGRGNGSNGDPDGGPKGGRDGSADGGSGPVGRPCGDPHDCRNACLNGDLPGGPDGGPFPVAARERVVAGSAPPRSGAGTRPVRLLGLDLDPAMVEAARANACTLGLADRCRFAEVDLRRVRNGGAAGASAGGPAAGPVDAPADGSAPAVGSAPVAGPKAVGGPAPAAGPTSTAGPAFAAGSAHALGLAPESADLVVANPPYRRPDQGRLPAADRARALFEGLGRLEDFLDAATFLVRNRGRVVLVHLAERLAEVLAALASRRLEPKRLRLVHSRLDGEARLLLVEAVKNGAPGMVVEPPLILYDGRGAATALTAEALDFCPRLACNAGPRA